MGPLTDGSCEAAEDVVTSPIASALDRVALTARWCLALVRTTLIRLPQPSPPKAESPDPCVTMVKCPPSAPATTATCSLPVESAREAKSATHLTLLRRDAATSPNVGNALDRVALTARWCL